MYNNYHIQITLIQMYGFRRVSLMVLLCITLILGYTKLLISSSDPQ